MNKVEIIYLGESSYRYNLWREEKIKEMLDNGFSLLSTYVVKEQEVYGIFRKIV
jgi:hypothetical protein